MKERPTYNFASFKQRIARAPINTRTYENRFGWHTYDPVRNDFTLDEINDIIRSGDINSLRELSRFYYRTNSEYRNNIDFLAHLPLYDTMVIPTYEDAKGSQTQIIKSFYNACTFIDDLDVPNTFTNITTEWLKNGIFYGILRMEQGKPVIQTLPLNYCRTRFKDFNNLNILEFNILYFETIPKEERTEVIQSFPEEVQIAWAAWIAAKKRTDPWVMLPSAAGGVCFCFAHDQSPMLIASIPLLKKMKDATGREEKRDENELYKLLIQKMPIDRDGELVFQLEEIADIHESVAQMLSGVDTVDVLTTLGDTDLESLQDTTAASQSADRLEKYRKNAWDALGRGNILFNPDGSSALAYMIKKDESLMIGYLNAYETWIKFHLNDKFSRKGLKFDFEILPTTVFNRQDLQGAYFKGAQYGYSKMFAGVAMGIKQTSQLSLMTFENDFLHMTEKMVPLQSSYTTSGNNSSQKTTNNGQGGNLSNTGGRPELPDEEKSEKTQANIAAAG